MYHQSLNINLCHYVTLRNAMNINNPAKTNYYQRDLAWHDMTATLQPHCCTALRILYLVDPHLSNTVQRLRVRGRVRIKSDALFILKLATTTFWQINTRKGSSVERPVCVCVCESERERICFVSSELSRCIGGCVSLPLFLSLHQLNYCFRFLSCTVGICVLVLELS